MTEGPCVNFVMREALYEIYTWILCLSYLHEKQTSRIQSLYLYFIKIVPFWLRNIRFFLIQNTQSLFYGRHYSSLHRLMSLHGKIDVKIFLMFIVAEKTKSVNILLWTADKNITRMALSPPELYFFFLLVLIDLKDNEHDEVKV